MDWKKRKIKYHGRREPYTEIGIRRLKCFRCKTNTASQQWQICANKNLYLPICDECDVKLNRMVIDFMRFPNGHEIFNEYVRDMEV